jgi:hypothetical protein
MMKTMIEVDLPVGVSKAEAEGAVKRAFDPNWVAEWWHIDDIIEQDNGAEDEPYSDLTEDEAREVLRLMIKEHDCEVGINWDVIDAWIDHVKGLRKEIA